MYPTSPTVAEWRMAGANRAKLSGIEVPTWYDGSTASVQRLNSEGLTDINAAILFEQNKYVLSNPDQFPQSNIDGAKAFIAKNGGNTAASYAAGYEIQDAGVLSQAGDLVKETLFGNSLGILDSAPDAAGTRSLWSRWFGADSAVKKDPKGFLKVAAVGVALGGLAWYAFGRKGGK